MTADFITYVHHVHSVLRSAHTVLEDTSLALQHAKPGQTITETFAEWQVTRINDVIEALNALGL